MTKFAIGQDSHRFETETLRKFSKPLVLGGVVFENVPALSANSDGDVVLHALTNAVSGITCKNVLGKIADDMCKAGITDSAEYLKTALSDLEKAGMKLTHVSFSIECKLPKISPEIEKMRKSISLLTGVPTTSVGITATSGEELTAFGRGEGIQVFCAVTAEDVK